MDFNEIVDDIDEKVGIKLNEPSSGDTYINTIFHHYDLITRVFGKDTDRSETAEKEVVLSDIVVTDQGIVNETWSIDSLYDSRVINLTEDIVTLEYKNDDGEFEEMDFESRRFKHLAPVEMFDLIRIEVLERECGDYRVKLLSGDGVFSPEIFENQDIIDSIPDDFFVSDKK